MSNQFAFGIFIGILFISTFTDGMKKCTAATKESIKVDADRYQNRYDQDRKKKWDALKSECTELCRVKKTRSTAVNRFGCMCADGTVTPVPGGLPQ